MKWSSLCPRLFVFSASRTMWSAALGSTSRGCTNLLQRCVAANLQKFTKGKASCTLMK
ncbi:unnamed protein product [Linum tenue]|uniref:Secreted protein n=1 Tax=Linum tenue TaxID=586396 RepID=A0AAV0I3I6_9ROSI|nr:unnamed protein product [Linum tenue]